MISPRYFAYDNVILYGQAGTCHAGRGLSKFLCALDTRNDSNRYNRTGFLQSVHTPQFC